MKPRTYDRDKEFKALEEWSRRDDIFTLLQFTTERGYPQENLSVWAHEKEQYSKTLRLAKERIALKREKLLHEGKVNQSAWNRYASLYDSSLKKHERAEKQFDHELKKKEIETQSKSLNELKDDLANGNLSQK